MTTSGSPTRADARRNYERLLAAAGKAFAEHGAGASLNDIARRAGVGAATLYRHFPTREALLDTLLTDRYTELATRADTLRAHPDPSEALITWLNAFIAHLSTFRGLSAYAKTALRDKESALYSSCHAMQAAWVDLVTHAQQTRTIRPDVAAADLLHLANAIAWATEDLPDRPAQANRLLRLALAGIH